MIDYAKSIDYILQICHGTMSINVALTVLGDVILVIKK
jgi:hypothetical protein